MKLKIKQLKLLPVIPLLLCLNLNAQGIEAMVSSNINESFLSSLPPDLRGDLLDGQNLEDPAIDAVDPKTRVTNLEASLKDAERTLAQIKSEIQSKYSDNDLELRRFGEDFFSSYQSTFLPVNEPNFGADYILDVGDKLTVQLVGTQKGFQRPTRIEIKRDGGFHIPEVGKIYLASKTFQEAEKLIKDAVLETFIGVDAVVTLSALRDMNILMVGNISQPGLYILQGGASVIQAIFNAGGITDLGSYRSISHKRNNKVIEKIDLYNLIAFGDSSFTHSLRSGDSIVVETKGAEINLSSESFFSAIYEILPGESFGDILKFSGFKPTRYKTDFPFQLSRASNQGAIYKTLNQDEVNNFIPIHGDAFSMNSIEPSFVNQIKVNISGEVSIPGEYTLEKGTRLSELLALTGGYTENAYTFAGALTRVSTKEVEKQINERIYQDMIKFIASNANAAQVAGGDSFALILNEFRNTKPIGRVTAEFDINKIRGSSNLDIALSNGDKIVIPEYKSEVYVLGDVLNPGARLYKPNNSAKDYIDRSGGHGKYAEKNRSIIIHPNGDAFLYNESIVSFKKNVDIYPGTIIYVPREIGQLDGINYAAVVAPIFSSLALSLASLNSIND
ncbi:SLBB domain-containing protein [Pseudomonadota bacterium]|nr:SLBB domain-containing protein [Pseudomonadota bacterium]